MPAIPVNFSRSLITFSILSEGELVPSSVGVVSISVVKEINRIPYAKVVLQDGNVSKQDFPISNEKYFIPGKKIEIKAGYNSDEATIFKGIIIKQGIKIQKNGNSTLTIDCKDEAVKMTIGRKSKYFYESSDSDVMEELIATYSLGSNIESSNIIHPELVQYRCTDWDFMLTRTEVNGKICMVNDGEITIQKPDFEQEPITELSYGSNLRSFEACIDARDQFNSVTAQAWDFGGQEMITAEAEEPSLPEWGNLENSDLAEVVNLSEFQLAHGGKANQEELQAWADAQLLRNRMAKIQGKATIQGVAEINAGNIISLEGVGERFNGKLFVSAIRHQIYGGDWLTDIQLGCNPEWFTETYPVHQPKASGLFPAIQGLQIGLVTELEGDPDGEDRIQVRLPIINTEEQGIWARVASLDAGENRGAFFRPEIGDEVIIGFINDDPGEAVVLGMLNSSAKPAPLQGSNDNHEKGFFTRSEMKIHFNDDEESITISNADGNTVEIKKAEINLMDSNNNEIKMNADGISIISGKDIILEATGNISMSSNQNIEASAGINYNIEGSANVEIKAGAVNTIKGSLIKIN